MAFKYDAYTPSASVDDAKKKKDQYAEYQESDLVKQYRENLANHEANKVGAWNGGQWGTAVNDALQKILNREKFSYDVNADALYQQYKDQYINLGNQAMMDTMGQAAAMTGGYGNSYAQTVGQQAYQGYLQGLNDRVPELYKLARDQYNQEGADLQNQYAMLADRYNTEYGEHRDKQNDWNAERDYLASIYNNERNYDYGQFSDNRNYYTDAYNNERNYDYGQYSDAYNRAFNEYQQKVSEQQHNESMALQYAKMNRDATIASLREQLEARDANMIDSSKMESYKHEFKGKNTAQSIEIIKGLADAGDINEAEYNFLMNEYGTSNSLDNALDILFPWRN